MASSKRNLKCVLQDIGNKHAAVRIGQSLELKVKYHKRRYCFKKYSDYMRRFKNSFF